MKIKSSGKEIELAPEVEEIARWWADVEQTDFAAPERIKENFWISFKSKLDPELGIKNLDELDFEPLRIWKEKNKEKEAELKKARPIEVRKKEEEEKQKAASYFQYCIIDEEP